MDKHQWFLVLQIYTVLLSIAFFIRTENFLYLIAGIGVFIGNYIAKDSIERQIKQDEEKEKLLGTTGEKDENDPI